MYADLTVIVAGAVDEADSYFDQTLLDERIAEIKTESAADGYRTEIYVRYHDHDISEEDCACAQYEQDGRPTYVFNPDSAI